MHSKMFMFILSPSNPIFKQKNENKCQDFNKYTLQIFDLLPEWMENMVVFIFYQLAIDFK